MEEVPEKKAKKSKKGEKEEGEAAAKSKRKEKDKAEADDKPAKKKAKKDAEPDAEEAPKKKATAAKEAPTEAAQPPADDPNSLDNFALSPAVRAKLREGGIESLFPIQAATFKIVMDGHDLVGRARTGQARRAARLLARIYPALTCFTLRRAQGKTLAFVLPILECLARDALATAAKPGAAAASKAQGRAPLVVVLAPTRELAKQARNVAPRARAAAASRRAADARAGARRCTRTSASTARWWGSPRCACTAARRCRTKNTRCAAAWTSSSAHPAA